MLNSLINHMKQIVEDRGDSVFSDLEALRLQKFRTYPARVIRYALQLRYTSLQAYKLLLDHLPLPSVSYLRKLTKGYDDLFL